MGLDISAAANKNKNIRNVLNKVSHEELKKKSGHKCVMINKKPWKATGKVTLRNSKSKIKSQIGIIPLKK